MHLFMRLKMEEKRCEPLTVVVRISSEQILGFFLINPVFFSFNQNLMQYIKEVGNKVECYVLRAYVIKYVRILTKLKKLKKGNFFLISFILYVFISVETKFNQLSALKTRNVPPTKIDRILFGTLTINMQILEIQISIYYHVSPYSNAPK